MNRLLWRTSLAVAFAAASSVGSVASAEVNLLANPGFEDNGGSFDGWDTFGSGPQISTPATDNIARSGLAAAKIFGEFTGCPTLPQFDVGGFFQSFTPTPGMDYELRGYGYVSTVDPIPGTEVCVTNRVIAKIVFFDAAVGGNEISVNEVLVGDIDTPLDQWVHFSVSAPAPAGAMRVQAMFLFLQPGCDEGSVFVDDTSFHERVPTVKDNLLANPSFDSSLTGWTTFGNVFHDVTSPGRSYPVRTAPGAAKLFSTFVPGSDSGLFQSFLAAPGSEWKMNLYSFTTCQEDPITETNDNFVSAKIAFRDGTGAEIGASEGVIVDNTSPLGTWTWHQVVAQAPPGTVTLDAFILFISPSLLAGAAWIDDVSLQTLTLTDVATLPRPHAFELKQNVPNPFGPATRIDFVLGSRDDVDISVYDVAGRRIAMLLQDRLGAGPHSVTWNGRLAGGDMAAAGIYRYVLRTSGGQTSRSMILVR